MKPLIEEVLRLQPVWTHINTPDMQRRGELIRREIPAWLKGHQQKISASMGSTASDLEVEGRDGTGPKSEIPWVRFYSAARSPSAHEGWYCVYLFRATGTGAYLCLGHGSTRYESGEFKPRLPHELAELVKWARDLLHADIDAGGRISTDISLEAKGNLGPSYERGTAYSVFYPAGAVPDANVLSEDIVRFGKLLAKLYNTEDLGRSPESSVLDLEAAQDVIQTLASPLKGRRGSGQGFGLTHAERSEIDRRAMFVALEHLRSTGHAVDNVSKNRPYDFVAVKDRREIIVEVKGTTGTLGSILLTANEVAAHQKEHPLNALIVVHSIELDRSANTPRATGGILHVISPWDIEPTALKPLSFQYKLVDLPGGRSR